MGYSYDLRGRLACDGCGACGDTRKRTCPHRVSYPGGGSLPYCHPAALCKACYAKHKATLHDGCKELAALENLKQQNNAARLAAGDYQLSSGWGSWHPKVPEGFVGALFVNRGKLFTDSDTHAYRLIPAEEYQRIENGQWLSAYVNAQPWDDHA